MCHCRTCEVPITDVRLLDGFHDGWPVAAGDLAKIPGAEARRPVLHPQGPIRCLLPFERIMVRQAAQAQPDFKVSRSHVVQIQNPKEDCVRRGE